MSRTPALVADFLRGRRIAVTGVSRTGASAANLVFRRLRSSGYEVFPVNPNASELEGVACYPDLAAVPAHIDGVMVVTHPNASAGVAREAIQRGIRQIWFHRSFGQGSVSSEAVQACTSAGIACIAGGCPLMYCEPVDLGHRCMRAWLGWRGRLPR